MKTGCLLLGIQLAVGAPAGASDIWVDGPNSRLTPAAQEHLERVQGVLAVGGTIAPENKALMDRWVPIFMSHGLIGRAPTEPERLQIGHVLPLMAQSKHWSITADECKDYSCISWAVGVTDSWLHPTSTIEQSDRFYLEYGYVPLSPGQSTDDADIALWAIKGSPRHGARRLSREWWETKHGPHQRIVHRLDDLDSEDYGRVAKFYRRGTTAELRGLVVRRPQRGSECRKP